MFAYTLASNLCSQATDIEAILSLVFDFEEIYYNSVIDIKSGLTSVQNLQLSLPLSHYVIPYYCVEKTRETGIDFAAS